MHANSLHFHAWHSVCAVCEIALIRQELFVPISFCWRFEVYPTQTSVFFSKSNFVKLQMLWISWKCDAICTIAFPCMTFYVCITCELICSAGRACALLPQSYPFLFQKKKLCIRKRNWIFTQVVLRIFQWNINSRSTWKQIFNLLRSMGVLRKHVAWKGAVVRLVYEKLKFWSVLFHYNYI